MKTGSSRLERMPPTVARFLGYRQGAVHKLSTPQILGWSFVGAFCGLAVLQGLFQFSEYFVAKHVPTIVASYGASAVLVFGAIEAPLAQPRALVFGHLIASFIGVCMTKLFLLASHETFMSLRWLSGSLSTALAIVAMQASATVHPPAGATALLPLVSAPITELGWYYIPVIALSSILMLAVGLLLNNIQRRYPVYWIAPSPPAAPAPVVADSAVTTAVVQVDDDHKTPAAVADDDERVTGVAHGSTGDELVIERTGIMVPAWLTVTGEERAVLERIQQRVAEGVR
ncbi:hypothetical protein RI367_003402 [Sorochytrium milnesiophthora]